MAADEVETRKGDLSACGAKGNKDEDESGVGGGGIEMEIEGLG